MIISNQELLDASIQIERTGKAFYAELSKYVKDTTAREFLKVMAQEEALHEEQFKEILATKGDDQYGWEKEQKVRTLIDNKLKTDIFPSIEGIMSHLSEMEGIKKALDFATEAEKVSAEFYELLGDACENIDIKTQLIKLEQAENEHLKKIKFLGERFKNKYNT
jgi:rubrerythrin